MWKGFILFIGIVIAAGFGGYNFLISKGSEVMINQIAKQVLSNEEEYNQLLNDPEIQKLLEKNIDNIDNLPFDTKEEAMKVVIKEFSVSEMNSMIGKAQSGEISKDEIYQTLQERLSEEEIQALMVIALREIQEN